MADISRELAAILAAVYGEEVRGSIHDAIKKINDVSEVILSVGTAVSSASSSSTGFYTDSLYLNSTTYELWKCIGTDSWSSQGILKGPQGDDGAPGADGQNGNKWYIGTGVSGTSTNPTVFSGSGVANAVENDCYMNKSEARVYHCTLGGGPTVATWVYDFAMSGGGGGGTTYTAGTGIDISPADIISIDPGTIASGNQKPVTGGDAYNALAQKAFISSVPTKTTELSDVSTSTPSDGDILIYSSSAQKYVPDTPPSGGHTMISNATYASVMVTNSTDTSDDDVASTYAIANWSNCDAIEILTTAAQDADGVGTWDDDWTGSGASRSGWIWDSALHGILSDDSIQVEPVFDISGDETVSLYAWRIDDDVQNGGVDGGAVALKFNGAIQNASGKKVGIKLIKQRTKVKTVTPLT